MALGFSSTLRNNRASQINSAVGSLGVITLYSGTRPAFGVTGTTAIASFTSTGVFASLTGPTLTVNATFPPAVASASGPVTWFRISTSGGTAVVDGAIGDITVNTTFVAGDAIAFTNMTITEGNA